MQDEENPAKLYNHGNEYLHYEDDWYVAAWKPDEYAFIYYKGNNDAWRGYGGATVYTRASSFPPEYAAEMQRAAEVRVLLIACPPVAVCTLRLTACACAGATSMKTRHRHHVWLSDVTPAAVPKGTGVGDVQAPAELSHGPAASHSSCRLAPPACS